MLIGLGCLVEAVQAAFDPEGGAYGSHAHAAGGGHAYRPSREATAASPRAAHDPGHGAHRSPAKIHEFK